MSREKGRRRGGRLLDVRCEKMRRRRRDVVGNCWSRGEGMIRFEELGGYRRHSITPCTYTVRVSRTDCLALQVADREAQRSPLRVRFVLLYAFVRSHVSPVRLRDDVVRRRLSLSCRRSRDTCACLRSFLRLFPTIISIRTWPSETRW